jgi:hypothetical protein
MERALQACSLTYERSGSYAFICERDRVSFEVEVCRLQRMQLLTLRFKRISGAFWAYKRLCNQLVCQLAL